MEPAAGSMAAFARTAADIEATGSKKRKVEVLAAYLAGLDERCLPVAARYFAGLVFPAWDGHVLSVGWAALRDALTELAGIDASELAAVWSRHADAGDTAAEVLAGRDAPGAGLVEVAHGLAEIAGASGPKAKAKLLRELLARCTPAEARVVVKLIAGEMRIGLREGLVEEAIAVAFAHPQDAVQRADMLAGDLGEVALLAKDNRLHEASPRVFAPIRFMLASPVAGAEEAVRRLGEELWVEDKYDGIRCQVHRAGDRVRLFSRDLKDVTEQFPEVVADALTLPHDVILDGEVLAYAEGRVLPFSMLQRRLGRRDPGAAIRAEVPVIHVAWDLLWEDGVSLLDTPLRERRARLEALRLGGEMATSHRETAVGAAAVDQLFLDARARLNEGLLLKDPDSPYLPGRRGLYWLKLKRPLDTLDTVVIGAEWGHGRRRDVLSDVTFAVRVDGTDELVPIGKAYTGLSDAEIATMTQLLVDLTTRQHGRYHSVRPEIVLEVAFDAVQPSSRHRSGYALRFPRIARWRHDKSPDDINLLSDVRRLAEAREHGREQRVDRAE